MQWGSQWATTTHSGINPMQIWELIDDRKGGAARGKPNPFVRVRPPQPDATPVLLDTPLATTELPEVSELSQSSALTVSDAVDRVEDFDRQQLRQQRFVDSRPSRDSSMTRVPSLVEQRLAVASQRLLLDEQDELEFMLLIAAATDDECYHL